MRRWSDEEYERRAQERFWVKVDKSGGPDACWPWTGCLRRDGYGLFGYRCVGILAHRFAAGAVDPTPGMEVCHSCGNPACCNPRHLRIGTHAENMKDMIEHGTSNQGERHPNARLTEDDVRAIRLEHAAGVMTMQQLASRYGIAKMQVSRIVNRKRWKYVN